MSTEAERLTAKMATVDNKAAEETDVVAATAASSWPSGEYNMFIPLVFISMCGVLASCVDVSTICLGRDYMIEYQYVLSTIYAVLMIYS